MFRFVMSSLRNKVILIIMIVLVVPLTMANIYFVNGMKSILLQDMESQIHILSSQVANSVNEVFTNMLKISNVVSLDIRTSKALMNADSVDAYEVLLARNDLEKILINVGNGLLSYKYHFNLVIVSNNKVMATSINDIEQDYFTMREVRIFENISAEEWYKKLQKKNRATIEWIPSHINYINPNSTKCISLVSSISSSTSNKILGYLIISINIEEISKTLKKFMTDYNGIIMIVDNENNFVFSYKTDQAISEKMEDTMLEHLNNNVDLDDSKIWIKKSTITYPRWNIVYGLSPKDIIAKAEKVSQKYFLIFEGLLTLFTIAAIVFINNLIKPLNKLKAGMKKIAKGNFKVSVDNDSMDEIGIINLTFNRMAERLDVLVCDIKEYERKEQNLKFEALQAQINPHFINNTLNTIKLSAEASQAYSLISMIEALGQMMKYCMNFNEDKVLVSQEILYIKQYVYLKNLQRINKIDLEIVADESVSNRMILKFIIQPIIENSFTHGFSKKSSGMITVSLQELDELLWITISDTGRGLCGQPLDVLISNKKKKEGLFSIGLKNVNERLKLKYGAEYSISASDGNCGGAVFTIKLPLEET